VYSLLTISDVRGCNFAPRFSIISVVPICTAATLKLREEEKKIGFISFVAYINLGKVFAYFVTFIQVVFGTETSALQPKLKCAGFSSFRARFFPVIQECVLTLPGIKL
jgi:hypothetical protein